MIPLGQHVVGPDVKNIELPTDPSTWQGLPSDVSADYAEDALTCISRFYFGTDITVEELDPKSSQSLIDWTVNYLTYIDRMRLFYTVMAFLRIIFCIVLLLYQVKRYYMNNKLTWFQVSVIWMI